jgi:integrase
MKSRFILFKRAGVFYSEDTVTRKQHSLRTKDEAEATTLLNAKNESFRQPVLNLQIARAYLTASDPAMSARTWQTVMEQMQTHGKDSSKTRYVRAMKCKAFDALRGKKLIETNAEDFLKVMAGGQVSVIHFLRRLHNLALALGWLAVPVLAPKLWPKPEGKPKRAITLAEHRRILDAEKNRERNLYYQLLWEVGASQSDAAALTRENIDRATNTLTYFRMKTGEQAQLAISRSLAAILEQLPKAGPLFPNIYAGQANLRASEFYYLCKRLKIKGATLHSYRYAWAERARTCGYPERFAQEALGHNSKAVHRAYARRANVVIPAMEDYERKLACVIVPMAQAA